MNSPLSMLYCDVKTVGGMPCCGIMRLTSEVVDPGGVARETWECSSCHAREFVTVYEAEVAGETPEPDEPESFCTFCHNPYTPGVSDELHACEACANWYRMQLCN